MFLTERQMCSAPSGPKERTNLEAPKARFSKRNFARRTAGETASTELVNRVSQASATPNAGNSCYVFNDKFLEFRTPFDEMRGGITLATCCLLGPLVYGMEPFPAMIQEMLSGINESGNEMDLQSYGAYTWVIVLLSSLLVAAVHFGWRHLRLEAFVQRRLLVRFNRKTRKVYLHRPAYAGGVLELPWDNVVPDGVCPGSDEASGIGASLMLLWNPPHSPRGEIEMALVGRMARSNSEITNLWEFIRRYMEEGPEGLPEPQTIGKFPWPWRGLESAWSFIWPVWRIEGLDWARWLIVLMSPLILIFAASHWLALLTCWEPVFPKAIRDACGEGWKDVLRTRMIDVGAWAMLAAVLAGLWQLI